MDPVRAWRRPQQSAAAGGRRRTAAPFARQRGLARGCSCAGGRILSQRTMQARRLDIMRPASAAAGRRALHTSAASMSQGRTTTLAHPARANAMSTGVATARNCVSCCNAPCKCSCVPWCAPGDMSGSPAGTCGRRCLRPPDRFAALAHPARANATVSRVCRCTRMCTWSTIVIRVRRGAAERPMADAAARRRTPVCRRCKTRGRSAAP